MPIIISTSTTISGLTQYTDDVQVAPGVTLTILAGGVLDLGGYELLNYGTHKTPAVKAWFARHPRFHVHFTPTSASWLNQVERWFATLTEKYIRRGTHRSTRQLEQAIRQYLELNNSDPKPFVWIKSADDILASIERFCLRISNSGH